MIQRDVWGTVSTEYTVTSVTNIVRIDMLHPVRTFSESNIVKELFYKLEHRGWFLLAAVALRGLSRVYGTHIVARDNVKGRVQFAFEIIHKI